MKGVALPRNPLVNHFLPVGFQIGQLKVKVGKQLKVYLLPVPNSFFLNFLSPLVMLYICLISTES